MSKVRFGDVVVRANTKEDKDNTDKIYYVGGEHIDTGEVLVTKRGIIKGSTIGPMFYFGFTSGQVLFVTRNPHLRKAGMAMFDGICSEKTFVLQTKDENILAQRFLPFVLQCDRFWKYAEANKSGSVNFFTNWSTLDRYEFDLPSIDKQRELAEILWAAYDTKLSYRKMIENIDAVVKAKFTDMFSNVNKRSIGEICSVKARIGWQGLKKKEYLSEGEYLLVTGVDFVENSIDFDHCFYVTQERYDQDPYIQLQADDVLVTKDGTIGKIAYVEDVPMPATLNSGVFVVRDIAGVLRSKYLFHALMSDEFNKFVEGFKTGSTIAHLNQKAFVNYEIPVPSFEEQDWFINFVDQAEETKRQLKESIVDLERFSNRIIMENLD